MKKRSLAGVIIFPFLTLGIYTLYWLVSTKRELNQKGAGIPTAWLIIIPIVNWWWIWKYFDGAKKVTDGKLDAILNFVLYFFLTIIIPMAICQNTYNKLEEVTSAPDPDSLENSSTIVTESLPETSAEQSPQEPDTQSIPNPPTPPVVQG